ncbi:MAG: hypothetical protein HY681_09905 [Chloroflexi bacterium]|nr:hypothetical protein [Chloroflexota bacterium]
MKAKTKLDGWPARRRASVLRLFGAAGVVALALSCTGAAQAPVQEVNAPPDSMVTATPFDPLHAPRTGAQPPDVVVEIDLENRYDFDLIPTRVNGAPVEFNRDHRDNADEPLRIPPGIVRFVLTNTGNISHNFRLKGVTPDGRPFSATTPAVDKFMGGDVMWEMEGPLWEGEYLMLCNVTNHDFRGMQRPLIVTADVRYPPPPLKNGAG